MKTVLINNYYSGIAARGVIVQVDNLCTLLSELGVEYRVLRSPLLLRRLPRQGVLFHIFEQIYVPLVGIFYDVVIYPYNSASVFSVLHRGSLLIVHDFIQNRPKIPGYTKASAKIVRITQCIYEHSGRNVAFITDEVKRQARWIGRFQNSRQYILPNCFAEFRNVVSANGTVHLQRYLLLCSGKVPTKDLAGALNLYASLEPALRCHLVILGLAGKSASVERFARDAGLDPRTITLLERITTESLKEWYEKAALVWVHSRREGFGRNIAEALLCGAPVVASKIPPFAQQAKRSPGNVNLYNNDDPQSFQSAVALGLNRGPPALRSADHDETALRDTLIEILC